MIMSKLNAYSVLDVKSKLFNFPHFQQTDGVAIRGFAQACEDESSNLNRYPEDFILHRIGEFNMETGELIKCERPIIVASASEFVPKPATPSQIKTALNEMHQTLDA